MQTNDVLSESRTATKHDIGRWADVDEGYDLEKGEFKVPAIEHLAASLVRTVEPVVTIVPAIPIAPRVEPISIAAAVVPIAPTLEPVSISTSVPIAEPVSIAPVVPIIYFALSAPTVEQTSAAPIDLAVDCSRAIDSMESEQNMPANIVESDVVIHTSPSSASGSILTSSPGRVEIHFDDVAVVDDSLLQGGDFTSVGKCQPGRPEGEKSK
ncbi:hypothetical protein NE237_028712 [Protea cynaroides]|uniref:Uncharacterized protein n=1 Tax=Protea cynaroides TaxID=273540 RepID=A0A9Q0GSX5_9MAGN|nr:hypothetical protein NE237_028712 [Protea cynaroides]